MIHEGGCHCGGLRFQVEGDVDSALACNCLICSKKGALLWAVAREKLTVEATEGTVGTYTFNNHAILHRFCLRCGMHPFAEDAGTGANRSAYVNLRCVEDIDIDALPVHAFDGRAM
ncbi:GFA family protein [Marinivivus vitaminiproducens]|uniref:GFA family protein n=1 Tax=Marinivivus vitaminiproducens TaxID=3035935 RepID=UPI0027A867B4|nr:GFA family protein [Geminicoccaceae bacterium SCSIO 64248]